MKHLLAVLVLVLVASVMVYTQVQPNGPQQGGSWGSTIQGNTSKMIGGPHDFGPGGAAGQLTGLAGKGQSKGVCDYCHRPHIKNDGVAAPLWARKLYTGAPFPVYSSVSLEAGDTTGVGGTGHIYPINTSDNYSAFCLSCHDGSAFLASTAWGDNGKPYTFGLTDSAWDARIGGLTTSPFTFQDARGNSGELNLTHTHPVNFDYDYVASKDQQIYAKAAAGYVFMDPAGYSVGRLFGGRMQCSSCHNPHFKSGIGLQGPSVDNGGALCVACHKK
jgi:hypothetical protein